MKRPKNFLFAIVLLSVLAIALAAAFHMTREHHPVTRMPAAGGQAPSPAPVSYPAAPSGTPSAAAQRRAKNFNDATNRFNAPDEPPR